jgi:hypothetical protein
VVEVTASAGVSTAVSLAAGSAGHADFLGEDTMAAVTMADMAAVTMADTMGEDTMADMGAVTMGVAFSALDILTIIHFIIPTINRILSMDLIWNTNVFRPVVCMRSDRMKMELSSVDEGREWPRGVHAA